MPIGYPGNSISKAARAKSGGGFESAVENAAGPALTGGNSALSYSIADLSRDAEVTISTDGTHSFGSIGPELTLFLDASLRQSNNATKRLGANTSETSAGIEFEVEQNEKLPGGYGIIVGSEGNEITSQDAPILRLQHTETTQIFEARMRYWPRNRAEAAATAIGNQIIDWQVKSLWNGCQEDAFGRGDETDFFANDFEKLNPNPPQWQDSHKVESNSGFGGVVIDQMLMDSSSSASNRLPYDEPYCLETLWDQGTVSSSVNDDGTVWSSVYSNVQGVHFATSISTRLVDSAPGSSFENQKITHLNYPGFTRGYTRSLGYALLDADIYRSIGPGAACRVAICDGPNYFTALNRTILEPVSWATSQVKVKLRGGWWDLSNLSGKYLCVIGANNQQIGPGVQIQ